MKVAITADLHLRTKKEYPERYKAIDNILTQCVDLGINDLLIAGDLFDKDLSSYTDFEALCKKTAYKDIKIKVIPGNHDSALLNRKFVLDNFEVIDKPKIIGIDENWKIMFVPYEANKLMGEIIQSLFLEIGDKKWVIVGHGDYIESVREINPYEPGIYMPLTRKDVDAFKPDRIFLGHIHQPILGDKVIYTGSPCGLNIDETGYRSFIVFDTDSNEIVKQKVENDILYFQTSLVVFPTADSLELLGIQIKDYIKGWDIKLDDEKKVRIRVKVSGYSSDRKALDKFIRKEFKNFEFEQEPDLSNVKFADDSDRDFIFEKCIEEVQNLKDDLKTEGLQPEIYKSILNLIYGG
ncbi:MAG: metallophosphoesterase family protein [Candidatus Helarchaeota archaeon]